MSKYIEEWDESIYKLLSSLTKSEKEDIFTSVWNNIINISTSILLSSFNSEVEKLIDEDKNFEEIYKKIRSEIKKPKKFLSNFANFLKGEDFNELFFAYLSDNVFLSWSFDLDDATSNKIDTFNVKPDDLILFIIIEDFCKNPNEWIVNYKFLDDVKIVDRLVDSYVANVISLSLDKSIDEY